ncbi:MAG: hypothetical protein ACYDCO_23855 [Armatimonadota bacterium]
MTSKDSGSRLWPLEFTVIDGAWCAAVPLEMASEVMAGDGQPADVILLESETTRVHGILSCGTLRTDTHFLVKLLPDQEDQERIPRIDLPRAA